VILSGSIKNSVEATERIEICKMSI
jgi:hypothetical protein